MSRSRFSVLGNVALYFLLFNLLPSTAAAQLGGWDTIPEDNAGLVFRVLDAAQDEAKSVTLAGFTTLQLASADGELDIRKSIDDNGFVFFTDVELQTQLAAAERAVSRINLMDPSGNEQRIAGHVAFNLSLDDLTDGNKRVDAVLYYFSDATFTPSDTYPRGGGDAFWNYYGPVENPMAMLIPPDERVAALGQQLDKTPVLFLHGIFNAYPFWTGGVDGGYLGDVNSAYDVWQLYYPYDQEIGKSASLLEHLLPRLLDPNDFNAAGVYGDATASSVPVVAHGVGGLVARAYMQSVDASDNKVSKLLMLGTPNHGTLLAYNSLQYKGFSWRYSPVLYGPRYDRRAPAVDQTILGSKFLHELNADALPVPANCVGASVRDCYLVVAGTKEEADPVHTSIEGQQDGVVSVSSVSLLSKEVPLITASLGHDELSYALDTSVIKSFLADRYTFDRFALAHRLHQNDYLDGYYATNEAGDTEAVYPDEHLLTTPDMGQIQVKLAVEDTDQHAVLYLWRKGGFSTYVDEDEMRFEYGCSQLLGRKTGNRMRRLHHQEGTTRFDYIDNFYISQRVENHVTISKSGFDFAEGAYSPVFYMRLLGNDGFPCAEFLSASESMSFRHLQTSVLDVEISNAQALMMSADSYLALDDLAMQDEPGRVAQAFQVDASVNAFVVHIRNTDAAALQNHRFNLVAPDGTLARADALAIEGASFDTGAGNHASFYIPNPAAGTWQITYDEALSGISLHLPVSSAIAFEAAFEETSHRLGDVVHFNLAAPAALQNAQPSARLYRTDARGATEFVQAIHVEAGADGRFAGYFDAAAPGSYSVLIEMAGTFEGTAVRRAIAIHTLIEGEAAEADVLPGTFLLEPNYPNPFNPSTTLRFNVPEDAQVRLSVFDITGKQVAVLVDAYKAAGQHETVWRASAAGGQVFSSGLYYAVLEIPSINVRQTRSMMLVK
ncbi:MAG: hypothetical protein AAF564_14270 [Bacteroidota bacterium]